MKIVGGPLTDEGQRYISDLKRYVKQHQLQDAVVFVSDVPFQKVVSHYQQADCFASMSETGSIDKTVLEAMSCGLPVVAGHVYTEIVGKKFARTWVISQNAEQLCERLLLLASMSELERRWLGSQLRAIVVSDHGLTRLSRRIVDELEELSR